MIEVWKDISDFKGYYQVSNFGNVRSLDRVTTINHPIGGLRKTKYKGKVLQQETIKGGYKRVLLVAEKKRVHANVACLVAYAFIGIRPDKHQVCHNDGNPANNSVENLRYDTVTNNHLDKRKHGTDSNCEKNPNAKLTNKKATEIRENRENLTVAQTCAKYGVKRSSVYNIRLGVSWGLL